MRVFRRRISGGYLAVFGMALLLAADIRFADNYPALRVDPHDHVADLIAASGVAVAFVLTYLAALTGLPSPGRQLLASALAYVERQGSTFAAGDAEGKVPQEEFRRLEEFLDRALDLARNDGEAIDAHHLFMRVIALAKPERQETEISIHELEKLGYSHFRATFLSSIVFKPNAERRHLLRATVLCAAIFSYTSLIYFLQLGHYIDASAVLMLGYPILTVVGAGFAVALSLRMWPHVVDEAAVRSILGMVTQAMQDKIDRSTNVLDNVIAMAREKRRREQPAAAPARSVTQEMLNEGVRTLSALLPSPPVEIVRGVYVAMSDAAPR
jgi:hypothetical protein